jgi:ribosomal protein L37AE/L43A
MTFQVTENVTQNTQNGLGARVPVGFEYFEDDSGRVKSLLAELQSAGVVLSIKGDQLAFDAPAGVITDELIGRMRADRAGLVEALRVPVDHGGSDHDDNLAKAVADASAIVTSSIKCPFCESSDLADDPAGLRCGSCHSLAWIVTAEGGLALRDVAEIELVDPDLVPVCPSCRRWCDVMTMAGVWRCSRCDPEADDRRRRTLRVIGLASRSRGRSVPSVR